MFLEFAYSKTKRLRERPAPTAVQAAIVSEPIEKTHRHAIDKLEFTFYAVMVKLERIEALVDSLHSKTPR